MYTAIEKNDQGAYTQTQENAKETLGKLTQSCQNRGTILK